MKKEKVVRSNQIQNEVEMFEKNRKKIEIK